MGIMKSELVRCQRSGAAALSMNACFLAPLRSPAEKEAGFTKASLWDTGGQSSPGLSARQIPPVPSNCSCRTARSIFFFLGGVLCDFGARRLCVGSGVGGWVAAFKY